MRKKYRKIIIEKKYKAYNEFPIKNVYKRFKMTRKKDSGEGR